MNYLKKHDKSLSMPEIVYSPMDTAGGLYYSPGEYEIELDGRFYDGKKGVIVVSSLWPENIEATLTHEWRHHWQRFTKGRSIEWPWRPSDDYENDIKNYFKAWHEWDALMFEYKFARNELNAFWVGLL